MLFMFKWETRDSTIWKGKDTKQENGTHFQIAASKKFMLLRRDSKDWKWPHFLRNRLW